MFDESLNASQETEKWDVDEVWLGEIAKKCNKMEWSERKRIKIK